MTAAKLVNDWTTGANLTHLYQPLDHPAYVDRFLDASAPMAAIFMESDFWPNLIHRTAERDIPVIFASSQISDAAAARWRRRPALAAAVFGTAELVLAVNDKQVAGDDGDASMVNTVVEGAVAMLAIALVILLLWCCCCRCRNKKSDGYRRQENVEMSGLSSGGRAMASGGGVELARWTFW